MDILDYLLANLSSTPQSLGDPQKDSPQEMEERHERVLTASLAAVAALLEVAVQQQLLVGKQPDSDGGSVIEERTASTSGNKDMAVAQVCESVVLFGSLTLFATLFGCLTVYSFSARVHACHCCPAPTWFSMGGEPLCMRQIVHCLSAIN